MSKEYTFEQAVHSVPGVESITINFATRVATVKSNTNIDLIIVAIKNAGYTAEEIDHLSAVTHDDDEKRFADHLLKQSFLAGSAGLILMVFGFTSILPSVLTFEGQIVWGALGIFSLVRQ